jgi:hypothetical protein
MTITVELSPEIEGRFLAQAKVRGLSLDAYVQEYLASSAQTQLSPELSLVDLDRVLDEAADLVPIMQPLSDFGMSRESIYVREDEW